MKPGKPLTFAEINSKPADNIASGKILAFGLPGNPVSCLVCFHLFVVPAIRLVAGCANPHLLRLLRLQKHFSSFLILTPVAISFNVGLQFRVIDLTMRF
jgi:molybdopterin biosynthesis enzyme